MEEPERVTVLHEIADSIAQSEPAHLIAGDLNQVIEDLLARIPACAAPVVFHSAVLAYLPIEARESFTEKVHALSCH